MRWAFYRRELGRPVPLVLLGLAVFGWIVVARLAWVHSESEHDFRRQVHLLTVLRQRRVLSWSSSGKQAARWQVRKGG